MKRMGLRGLETTRNCSAPGSGHRKFPYLLRGVPIERCNHVWSSDITYIPMIHGFMYLTAVMDWYSRMVLSWELPNTLTSDFCVMALNQALRFPAPEIFNTDQGSQLTSEAFLTVLEAKQIRISMDGRGRALDNVFIERLWRSVKYEVVCLKDYQDVVSLRAGLKAYFSFYNVERPHQSLGYRTPSDVYDNRSTAI